MRSLASAILGGNSRQECTLGDLSRAASAGKQRSHGSASMLRPVLAILAVSAAPVFAEDVDFNRDVRPILSNKCYACHGPDDEQRQAGLRLDDAKIATHELESGATAIAPGNPDASELLVRVTSSDDAVRMPPAEFGKPLTPAEIATLRKPV